MTTTDQLASINAAAAVLMQDGIIPLTSNVVIQQILKAAEKAGNPNHAEMVVDFRQELVAICELFEAKSTAEKNAFRLLMFGAIESAFSLGVLIEAGDKAALLVQERTVVLKHKQSIAGSRSGQERAKNADEGWRSAVSSFAANERLRKPTIKTAEIIRSVRRQLTHCKLPADDSTLRKHISMPIRRD